MAKAPVEILESLNFRKFHNGGGTVVYRRDFGGAELIVSGVDGDVPSNGWYAIGLYQDWEGSDALPQIYVADASAEFSDFPSRVFAHDLAFMIEFAWARYI